MVETDRKMNDGGPAWPVAHDTMRDTLRPGMSLRDYFAAQALVGFIAAGFFNAHEVAHDTRGGMNEARLAYKYADAMLAARSNNG